MTNPVERLKHHVSGAIARGESVAIVGNPAPSHPYMGADAAKIVDSLIDSALASGLCITVHDGECYAVKCQTDKQFIWENLAQTDSIETLIFHYTGTMERVGVVELIYENGVDVICDHTDNSAMNRLLAPAFTIAESMQ